MTSAWSRAFTIEIAAWFPKFVSSPSCDSVNADSRSLSRLKIPTTRSPYRMGAAISERVSGRVAM